MPHTMKEFIARLERDVDRWRGDVIKFQVMKETALVESIREWIAEAEKIIEGSRHRT